MQHIHTWLLYRRYGSVSTCAWILSHPSPSLAMKQPVNWRRPTHNSSEHWTKSEGVLLAVETTEENPVTNLFIATALNLALKTISWALPSLLWCARELRSCWINSVTVPSMFYTTPTWFADSIIPRLRPVWQEKNCQCCAGGVWKRG